MALRPTPMMMQPPQARLPGSPIGGPGGPGPTPMMSPGQGAGVKAAAIAQIKAAMRNIQLAALSFDPGTREYNGSMAALTKLNPIFGKASDTDLDPAARARMAQPPPSPLAGMAPAGMAGGGGGPPPAGPSGAPPTSGIGDQGGGNPAFP